MAFNHHQGPKGPAHSTRKQSKAEATRRETFCLAASSTSPISRILVPAVRFAFQAFSLSNASSPHVVLFAATCEAAFPRRRAQCGLRPQGPFVAVSRPRKAR